LEALLKRGLLNLQLPSKPSVESILAGWTIPSIAWNAGSQQELTPTEHGITSLQTPTPRLYPDTLEFTSKGLNPLANLQQPLKWFLVLLEIYFLSADDEPSLQTQ
jgi:hypothetical protein